MLQNSKIVQRNPIPIAYCMQLTESRSLHCVYYIQLYKVGFVQFWKNTDSSLKVKF